MNKMKFVVRVTISAYLKQLKKDERQKPLLERRRIPIGREIAEAAGVSLSGYYQWSRNQADGINRKLTGAAIGLLRHHGFPTTFDDILEFVSSEDTGLPDIDFIEPNHPVFPSE